MWAFYKEKHKNVSWLFFSLHRGINEKTFVSSVSSPTAVLSAAENACVKMSEEGTSLYAVFKQVTHCPNPHSLSRGTAKL